MKGKRRGVLCAILALALAASRLVDGGAGRAQQVATFPKIGEWSTAQLSGERTGMAATSVGTLALFAGGFNDPLGHAPASEVDIYDSATGQWRTARLSGSRWGLAATSVGSLALFAGGPIDNLQPVPTDVVDVYDAAADQWSTAKLSQPRWGVGATSAGNIALFAGGVSRDGATSMTSATVDLYDATAGQWRTASLSQPRLRPAATSVGSLALFAGGILAGSNTADASDVVDIYNSATKQWSTAKLSHPRATAAAASVGALAFFAGDDDVDVYNAASGQWSTMKLPHPARGLAAAAVGTAVLFAGGRTPQPLAYTGVDIYESATGEWSTMRLSQSRTSLAATSVGTLALFAGGSGLIESASGLLSDRVDVYQSAPPAVASHPDAPACAVDLTSFGYVWRTQPWVQRRLGCPLAPAMSVTIRERHLDTAPGARGYWMEDESAEWFELAEDSAWAPRSKVEQPWPAAAETALRGQTQRFDGGAMLWLPYPDGRRRILVLAAPPPGPAADPIPAGEWRELPDPLAAARRPPPIAPVPTPIQCPQATPEPFWVNPVTSPTDQLTQDVSVYAGQVDQVLVVTESGAFGVGGEALANPVTVRVTLLPETTHHLYVIAMVKAIVKSGGELDGCVYGGYTLTTTHDRAGAPLVIEQRQALAAPLATPRS